jgi:hypothetical protein
MGFCEHGDETTDLRCLLILYLYWEVKQRFILTDYFPRDLSHSVMHKDARNRENLETVNVVPQARYVVQSTEIWRVITAVYAQ